MITNLLKGSIYIGKEDVFSIQLSENNIKILDEDISSIAKMYDLSDEEKNELEHEIDALRAVFLIKALGDNFITKSVADISARASKLIIENIFKADVSGDTQTAMHPVESAKNIIDHKFSMPRQINMTVLISRKDVGGIIGFYEDKDSMIQECERKLELWRKIPLLIKIYGQNGEIYDNFLLKSYRKIKNRENYACFEADISFVEMPIVEPQKTTSAISSITEKTGSSRTLKEG